MSKLTKAQRAMLSFYETSGPTAQSNARGTLNTWRSLTARGLLTKSSGPLFIDSEITTAGRQALNPSKDKDQ